MSGDVRVSRASRQEEAGGGGQHQAWAQGAGRGGYFLPCAVSRESTWGLGEGENKQHKIKGVMYSKIFVCFGQILI